MKRKRKSLRKPTRRRQLNVEVLECRENLATLGLTASSYTVAENVVGGQFQLTVTRDTTGVAETVNYAITPATAVPGVDYAALTSGATSNAVQPLSGTLSFSTTDTSKTVTVRILDATQSSTVQFNVALSNPTFSTLGTSSAVVNITPFNPGHPVLASIPPVGETAGSETITVNRVGGSDGVLNVNYATVDGTAVAGVDYTSTSGTLTWANGDSSPKSFNVPILNPGVLSGSKTFQVSLGDTALGTNSVVTPSAFWNFDNSSILGSGTNTPAIADQSGNGLNLVNTSKNYSGSSRSSYDYAQPAPFNITNSDGSTETSIIPSGATFPGAGQAYQLQSGIDNNWVGTDIASASWSGGVATYTTTTPFPLQVGETVNIGGSNGANPGVGNSLTIHNNVTSFGGSGGNYNGIYVVTSASTNGSSTTFTVNIANNPGNAVPGTGVVDSGAGGPIWWGPQTYVASPLLTTDTTITVSANTVGFPAQTPFYIELGGSPSGATEVAQVTAISGNTWKIVRNVGNNTPFYRPPTGTYSNTAGIADANYGVTTYGYVTLVEGPTTGVSDQTNLIQGNQAYRDLLSPYPTGPNNANLPGVATNDARTYTNSNLNDVNGVISYSFWLDMPQLTGADFNSTEFGNPGSGALVAPNYVAGVGNRTQLLGRGTDSGSGNSASNGGVIQVITDPYYTGKVGTVSAGPDGNGNLDTLTNLTSTVAFNVGDVVSGTGISSGTTVAAILSGSSLLLSQPLTSFIASGFIRVIPGSTSGTIAADSAGYYDYVNGLTTTYGYQVGDPVTGTGIPSGTTIAAIVNGTTLQLSQSAAQISDFTDATAPVGAVAATISNDSMGHATQITVASIAGYGVGDTVTGTGIPANTTIVSISGNTLTVSNSVSVTTGVPNFKDIASASAQTVTISQDGGGNFTQVSVANGATFFVGEAVTGSNIPSGATVTAINGNILTLSASATTTSVSTAPDLFVNVGYNSSDQTDTVKYTFQLRMDNTGLSASGSASSQIPWHTTWNLNQWNQFVITYARNEAFVYMNGVLMDTLTNIASFNPSTNIVYPTNGDFRLNNVGYSSTLKEGGVFNIDDFGIFQTSLSPSDVLAIKNKGIANAELNTGTVVINDTVPIQVERIAVNAGTSPILSASESGSTVTIVTDGAHGYSAGDPIVIAGVGGSYDGTYTIASVSANSFTIDFGSTMNLLPVTGRGTATDTALNGGLLVNGSSSAVSQRSMVDSVVYKFNQAVSLDATAFSITALGGGAQVPSLSVASPDGGLTWVVTFSGNGVVGNSVANGQYQIVLLSSKVTAATGSGVLAADNSQSFYRLFGDTIGNGHYRVSSPDRNAFNGSFGLTSTSANFLAYLDFNDDGRVSAPDRNAFNGDFGLVYSGFSGSI